MNDNDKTKALMGLAELIKHKKLQIESSSEMMLRDLEAFRITSQGDTPAMTDAKKRLVGLVSSSRKRKIARVKVELAILQAADDALRRIAEIAGQHTTIDDPREFNEIFEEAQKPYQVGIDWAVGCEPKGKEEQDGGE